ncbi:MAG: hypothetical protein ACFE95_06805, partial [Candidatus Hodarchaeota archaeon]
MLKRPIFYILIFILINALIIGSIYLSKTDNSLDPIYQWNLIEVGVEEAWCYTKGNPEIIIAVIDSGIDFNHPDLINQSWVNLGEIP